MSTLETTKNLTTQQVANKLVKLCRENKYEAAIHELYDDNIISLEPEGAPNERVAGKAAVLNKTTQWLGIVEEVHSIKISDPIVAGNYISVGMEMDITLKEVGRVPMDEICLYQVKDGKIVYEQFFYEVS